jgi:hypothetical protein
VSTSTSWSEPSANAAERRSLGIATWTEVYAGGPLSADRGVPDRLFEGEEPVFDMMRRQIRGESAGLAVTLTVAEPVIASNCVLASSLNPAAGSSRGSRSDVPYHPDLAVSNGHRSGIDADGVAHCLHQKAGVDLRDRFVTVVRDPDDAVGIDDIVGTASNRGRSASTAGRCSHATVLRLCRLWPRDSRHRRRCC